MSESSEFEAQAESICSFSLSQVAQMLGASKTSVHRWCARLGIETGSGITAADIEKLRVARMEANPADAPSVVTASFLEKDLEEDGDNGVTASADPAADSGVGGDVALPVSFDPSAAIAFFLTDEDDGITTTDETSRILEVAEMAIEKIEDAMDTAVQRQRKRLMRAEEDATYLRYKIIDFAADMRVSALEARMLDAMSKSSAREAEFLISKLLSMGKPKDQDGDTPPS